jgi:hypothetical protein
VAGKIKQLIDKIIEERAKGNETIRHTTRTKLLLKGINPDSYTVISEDNPEMMSKLQQIAIEMGVKI